MRGRYDDASIDNGAAALEIELVAVAGAPVNADVPRHLRDFGIEAADDVGRALGRLFAADGRARGRQRVPGAVLGARDNLLLGDRRPFVAIPAIDARDGVGLCRLPATHLLVVQVTAGRDNRNARNQLGAAARLTIGHLLLPAAAEADVHRRLVLVDDVVLQAFVLHACERVDEFAGRQRLVRRRCIFNPAVARNLGHAACICASEWEAY